MSFFFVCVLGTPITVYAASGEGIQKSSLNVYQLNNIENVTTDFLNQLGNNKTSRVVGTVIDAPENGYYQPEGVVTITTKVLKKLLKEKLDTIVKNVRKVPGVGNAIGDFLEKNAGSLISFLDKVEGGAYEALVRFFVSRGMQQSTAEIWADVIVTVVGWLI